MKPSAPKVRSKTQRTQESYRRARRKLAQRRLDGPRAVGEYLVDSHVARRLVGMESRRPVSISQIEISEDEKLAFRLAWRERDALRAAELGGEPAARTFQLERTLASLNASPMQDLMRRLYAIGGHQLITFGFADDSYRRVLLLPSGTDLSADGHPHTPLADLVRRAFTDIHGAIIVVRTDEGETINVYEASSAEFHQEKRKEIYAAAVIGHVAVYFDPEQARASLESGTWSPLPRVPGTVYCEWPRLAPTDQGGGYDA